MRLILEFLKFIIYTLVIVLISKYFLVPVLRKLAEALKLKPKTVGNITGLATSAPELLTVCFSSVTGLTSTSTYNIISSNIINLVQYLFAVYLNKNQKNLQNRAIKIDLTMVIFTIIIPILLFIFKINFSVSIVPAFVLLFLLFYYINANSHKLYLNKKTSFENKISDEQKWVKGKKSVIIKNSIFLVIISVMLYFTGNLLGNNLKTLCHLFKISEWVIGILLGFITSIPELITFIESQKHYKFKKENSEDGVIEATNNLLTSNIVNLFIIQSLGIIIYEFTKL